MTPAWRHKLICALGFCVTMLPPCHSGVGWPAADRWLRSDSRAAHGKCRDSGFHTEPGQMAEQSRGQGNLQGILATRHWAVNQKIAKETQQSMS